MNSCCVQEYDLPYWHLTRSKYLCTRFGVRKHQVLERFHWYFIGTNIPDTVECHRFSFLCTIFFDTLAVFIHSVLVQLTHEIELDPSRHFQQLWFDTFSINFIDHIHRHTFVGSNYHTHQRNPSLKLICVFREQTSVGSLSSSVT